MINPYFRINSRNDCFSVLILVKDLFMELVWSCFCLVAWLLSYDLADVMCSEKSDILCFMVEHFSVSYERSCFFWAICEFFYLY